MPPGRPANHAMSWTPRGSGRRGGPHLRRTWWTEESIRTASGLWLQTGADGELLLPKSYYWQPIGSPIWEIDWYQNEWPWPLFRGRIKVMSTIALHSTLNIAETVRERLQRTTWHMGFQMVTWPMTSRDRQRCCQAVRSAILATASARKEYVARTNFAPFLCILSHFARLNPFNLMTHFGAIGLWL